MKKFKLVAMLLAVVMIVPVFAGCKSEKETKIEAFTVTDMVWREVTFNEPADKIVVLTASDCEILFALGAGEAVIGRGTYCDYPQEALAVTEVNSGYETNVEQIIALEPQVIITSKMDQSEEQIELFENAGIDVIVTDAQTIEGTYRCIELIGKVVGKEAEAEKVINEMVDKFVNLAAKADENKGTVYFEASPLMYDLWTTGEGTFMNELANMLGITNIFNDVEGWAKVSEEQVIERDPDFIFTTTADFGEEPSPVDEIMSRVGWQNMKAIKNSKVYMIESNLVARPGPRLADAMEAMFSIIYE